MPPRKARKPRTDLPRVTVNYSSCFVYSTEGMLCPMCQTQVPPNVAHNCSKKADAEAR